MHWGLLLFPAIGGYWLLTHWNFSRYTVSRQSGYHLLFRSGAYGITLFMIAYGFAWISRCAWSWNWLNEFVKFSDKYSPDPLTTESILTLALALIAPFALNIVFREEAGLRRAVRDAGEHVELLIIDSADNGTPIEVTLENRRVYIGVALRSGVGNSPDADAAIFPHFSGHRDEKTLQFTRDTVYTHIVSQHIRNRSTEELERFRIVIPMARIVSARPFEQTVFDDFERAREKGEQNASAASESSEDPSGEFVASASEPTKDPHQVDSEDS